MKRACVLSAACMLAATNGYVACFADEDVCCLENPTVIYQIIELGVPDECVPGVIDVRAFGINNRAQIVGQVICAGDPDVSHGFVWFPIRPSHGHPDLEIVLLDTEGYSDSSANDLNDRAFVVGWQGSSPTLPGDAVVWDLTDPDLDPTSIPPPDDEDMVEAVGINDKSTFQVVGWLLDGSDARGFVWTNGDNSSTALNPAANESGGQWTDAMALAINNDSNALIGGTSEGISGNPNVMCADAGGDATVWLKNGSQTGTQLPQQLFEEDGKELAGEVRGVNDADNLVGYGVECFQSTARLRRALYWESRNEEPINLGDLVAELSGAADESVANAITNDDDPVTIVGMNTVDDFAVVWNALESDPSTESDFCIIDLNDAIDQSTDWTDLIEATDINDDGWIVGYGRHDGNIRAFLLIPAPQECVGDTNDDGEVDVDDLVNVVLDWLTDGSSNGGDVDGSGIVNVLDLIAVVLNWGLCPGETGTAPDSLSTELQSAGLSWDDWDDFVDNIDDENYRCWMDHYLNGECCALCPTCPPDCPDDDPFGGH